ncbi:MAG TPA: SHOCT domain-containing protein [Kofleriaceae bacterium]|jgi:hypothetical protein
MIYVCAAIIGGFLCSFVASSRQRSSIAWFAIGFLLPLIGFILIMVLPPGQSSLVAPPGVDPYPQPISSEAQAKAAVVARDSALDTLARLADMKERGAISETEFEDKKRELLARV